MPFSIRIVLLTLFSFLMATFFLDGWKGAGARS